MGRGARRHLIRFERQVKTDDGGGGVSIAYQEIATEWAEIERVQSFRFDVERMQSGAVGSFPTVRLHVDKHFRTEAIDNLTRCVEVHTGKVYAVNFVQDLEGRGRKLAITATENAPS